METLKMGIIGCGNMGQSHISTMREIDSISIAALSDPVQANVAEAAAMVDGGAAQFDDYNALLADPDVQGVVVATPNFLHAEVTIAALQAGKDVLCEKPMALTVEDCDAMWSTAQRLGRKLMAGQVLRLMHPFVEMRELIASGEIGEPRSANIERISGAWLFTFAKTDTWRMSKEKTGGLLYEINAHELDLLRSVFGEPTQVYAKSVNVANPNHDYEDTNLVLADFERGQSATLYGSSASAFGRTTGTFFCSEGSVTYRWGFDEADARALRYQKFDDDEPTPVEFPDDHRAGLRSQAQSFAKWVLEDVDPEVTGWDGRQSVAMAEAAYESARTNLPVKVR
ncbi:MAG: Gfo/Idh/MocA family oxidoreductase [Chloroflexi bacterium]|nr:Gfo/Idh/MocA family oxidoreductase [Chloroflexota bacterium]MCY3938004.1 Gfo/Idh/MocA family oxidoreductase [Chloroflexota bacterium]